jgi:TolA-binding protein
MKSWRVQGLILYLASALCVACAPKPVVPSGESRIPVNSEEVISQYRERVKGDHRDRVERSSLARQVDALTKQVQELKAYVTLLQLQQQESDKGRVRQVQPVGVGSPPFLSQAADKTATKDKAVTVSLPVFPLSTAPINASVVPMIAMEAVPTDTCGPRPGAANFEGWIDLTSDYLNRSADGRADHGPCRSVTRGSAPSFGTGVWCSGSCQAQ